MPKFSRKHKRGSLAIDAVQYTGDNMVEVQLLLGLPDVAQELCSDDMIIQTRQGDTTVLPGDWVIRGFSGIFTLKPDMFEATYEPAE